MSIEIWDWGLGYIYLWDILIAWKWGESWWKPWSNTIAYYPLNWNVNDASGNGYNWTRQWTSHYETLSSWIQVASFPKDTSQVNYISSSLNTEPKTVSFWVKQDNYVTWSSLIWMVNAENWHWQLRFTDTSWTYYIKFYWWETNLAQVSIIWSWTNIVLTMDNWTVNLYANWVLKWTLTWQTTSPSWTLYIGWNRYGWNNTNKRNLEWYMSEVILESVVWTATEISNYYNATKSNYWL